MLLAIPAWCIAQVGPFTNNTVNTASAETIDTETLDMQLASEYYISTQYFDSDGKKQTVDEGVLESGISLQFNSGITEKLEWGIALPIDASELSLGLKYNVASINESLMIAVAGWTDLPTGGREDYGKKDKNPDNISLAGFGTVFQYSITESMNVYADIFGQKYYSATEPQHKLNLYTNLDIDYALSDAIRLAGGFAYQSNSFESSDENSSLGTISYCVFFEKWDNWNLQLAHYTDIMGKNNSAGDTFMFNITRSF